MPRTLGDYVQDITYHNYLMLDLTSHPDILKEQAEAHCSSCSQPWFGDVPPESRQQMLQSFAEISWWDDLSPYQRACEMRQPETRSLPSRMPTAFKPVMSFLAAGCRVANSQSTTAAAKPPDAECPLTDTALFQSAALTAKIVAWTGCRAPTCERKRPLRPPLIMGRHMAQHISNSEWADGGHISPALAMLLQDSLMLLRQCIKQHQQQKKEEKTAEAAETFLEILQSLLRPGTHVAAHTAEAMYTSCRLQRVLRISINNSLQHLDSASHLLAANVHAATPQQPVC